MKWYFTALTKQGKREQGEIEAKTRQQAVLSLKRKGLTVTTLLELRKERTHYFGRVSILEKITFTRHLSIMLRAGIVLFDALQILELQTHGKMRTVITRVRKSVSGGSTLAGALEEYGSMFGVYYINMVRAGEESGQLPDHLEQLADRSAKDYELRQKAQSAMLYPAIVLTLTGGLGVLIALFVLPRLTSLFSSFNFELPLATRILFFISTFLSNYGTETVLVGITAIVGGVALSKAKFAAPVLHRLYLHLPIVRRIALDLNLARFSLVLGSLLASGIPIRESLKITSEVLVNQVFHKALSSSIPKIAAGEPLSSVLEEHEQVFPPFVTHMIAVGEESGQLESVLTYLAEFYERELDQSLKNVSTLIEPVLLIIIGLLVTFVALAVITPVYNFIDVIG